MSICYLNDDLVEILSHHDHYILNYNLQQPECERRFAGFFLTSLSNQCIFYYSSMYIHAIIVSKQLQTKL